ncbi:MAG: Fic family protein [Deltaproteobacteria bacterium]|nr:Fic family protein [Deltaproteobacteria bacterium]
MTLQLKAIDLKAARRAELLAGLDRDSREAIHRQARISTIGASTRIENAVLTDAEIEWIDTTLADDGRPTAFAARRARIEAKLSVDRERSIEEVAGCREMLSVIYSQAEELFPLSEATLCGLHRELLKHYPQAAFHLGRYKLVPNSVIERDVRSGSERTVLQTSDPGPITVTAMAELLAWYNRTLRAHPWPLAVGCELVFRFLACHPFQDGNGRLGRSLFLLALIQSADPSLAPLARYLAVDRFIEQHKAEYYSVLARVSGGRFHPDPHEYDIQLFLAFMIKAVDAALDSIVVYKKRIDTIRALSESATGVLQCFKEMPEQRLTPRFIRQQTALPERTVSRILRGLVDEEILQRYGRGAATRYQLVF